MAENHICELPSKLKSSIRTGIALGSVNVCVEELVANALDAGAICIAVRVDLSTYKIQVVDNGCGISQDQLQKVGNR